MSREKRRKFKEQLDPLGLWDFFLWAFDWINRFWTVYKIANRFKKPAKRFYRWLRLFHTETFAFYFASDDYGVRDGEDALARGGLIQPLINELFSSSFLLYSTFASISHSNYAKSLNRLDRVPVYVVNELILPSGRHVSLDSEVMHFKLQGF